MISTDLLVRLQEADPELWKHYQDGMITGAGELIPFFDESLTEAWLQHCIQAAIRARGWSYAIGISSKGIASASVYVPGGDGETIMGYDEVDALMRAYLAAL